MGRWYKCFVSFPLVRLSRRNDTHFKIVEFVILGTNLNCFQKVFFFLKTYLNALCVGFELSGREWVPLYQCVCFSLILLVFLRDNS